METKVQIDAPGSPLPAHLREHILDQVAGLEKRFGRIIACRVTFDAPSRHHSTGGQYSVKVHLTLPDRRDINVDRKPDADERFADPAFAINDAFKRARRRIQDQVRRMQGAVKIHVPQPMGVVSRLERDRGFGFLTTAEGREVYFHHNSVLDEEFDRLQVGARVSFVEEEGEKGAQASTVRVVGRH
jgi:cold shock CspA family protein/ribosome-associated translation inhibitor RaiA